NLYTGGARFASALASGSGSWSVSANFSTSGSYTVSATATDAAGNASGASSPITIDVDAVAPTVRITTPADTIFVPGATATITGSAGDDRAVTAVYVAYYDATNKTKLTVQTADCAGCPASSVTWSSAP